MWSPRPKFGALHERRMGTLFFLSPFMVGV
nr:MAG TPA: hypothetical protein [Caudoviricetes sp.]